jgi:hypothetical protein
MQNCESMIDIEEEEEEEGQVQEEKKGIEKTSTSKRMRAY